MVKCPMCKEREAVGRFLTLDGKKKYRCKECSKGLQPASWLKREKISIFRWKLSRVKIVVITLIILAHLCIFFALYIYTERIKFEPKTLFLFFFKRIGEIS